MDAIRKAISEVKFRIPKAILERAFVTRVTNWRMTNKTNVEDQILNLVILPRVLMDCNILGGQEVLVPLEGLNFDKPDSRTTVIHIPKTRTAGRTIVSVLHVSFLSQGHLSNWYTSIGSTYNHTDQSALMSGAIGVMNALDKIPVTTSSNVKLISENTIMIRDSITTPQNAILRCMVNFDDNLNDLPIRSIPAFCKAVEYAVKSYIYNELVIEVDTAELVGGQELGIFKTVMESYSDAEQNYQDYLREHMQAILLMSSTETYRRLLKLTIGSNR